MNESDHRAALDRLLELTLRLHEDINRGLAGRGLTVSRTSLLWTLRRTGPCPQRVLAEALGVTARTVTGLVDALADAGLVTREPHPTDRRSTLVTATESGTALVAELEREQAEFGRRLFAGMSGERFTGLVDGLTDVLDALRGPRGA